MPTANNRPTTAGYVRRVRCERVRQSVDEVEEMGFGSHRRGLAGLSSAEFIIREWDTCAEACVKARSP